MKMGGSRRSRIFGSCFLIAMTGFLALGQKSGAAEEMFNELQVGTQTYKNVTVTTKSKGYVFILHSAGMTNIRVNDLPEDVRLKLGYNETAQKPKTNNPTAWAKQTFSKLETPEVKGMEEKLATAWHQRLPAAGVNLPPLTTRLIAIVTGVVLLCWFLFCYCCMLICQKTGNNPGLLIFVPFLQTFPLLRAASMSPWWFFAVFVPGLNLVAQIIWFVKIVQARAKSGWLVLWLLLPLTNLLAFLYLAFSNGNARRKSERRQVEIMTLETA